MPGRFCCGEGEDGPAVGGKAYLWCVSGDYCAYFTLFFIYFSLFLINITTILFCIRPLYGLDNYWGISHTVGFQFICLMVFISHVSASWSDPGLVSKDTTGIFLEQFETQVQEMTENPEISEAQVKKFKKRFCQKCKTPKPVGAHHCSSCQRCVREMDHHCPWINNCVGQRNLKMFFLFLFYTAIGTGYASVMFALRAYSLLKLSPHMRIEHRDKNFYLGIVIACVVAFVVAVFFFIFVMCMCYDQYEALTTGVPGIESMSYRGEIPKKQSVWVGLKSMVQRLEPFGWRWFIPFAAKSIARKPDIPSHEE